MTADHLDMSWATSLADKFDPPPNPYAGLPIKWINERMGEHLTGDQRKICQSVADHRYTAVQSCHDVGKSYSASRITAWWLDSHPAGEAFVVTTAPTAAQVGAILWREIGKAHRKAGLNGRITGDNQWKLSWPGGADELVAVGRKPADYDPTGLQGYHARYVLVIIDEACGVPKTIYEALDSLVTNRHCRVLAIGNPDDPSSYFAEVCKPGSGWNVIHIDALRQATFTKEEVAQFPRLRAYMIREGIAPSKEPLPADLYDMLVSPMWVDERLKRWGENSPIFTSKVRGKFPNVSIDSLIHPHWVTLAQARETEPRPTMARMGVDVARYGVDHTIIMLRQGGHCRVVEDIPYGPVTQAAGLVVKHGYGMGVVAPVACVDDTGVGGGVTDILMEQNYPVVPIIAGETSAQRLPNGKPRFFNRRAELMWNLREALAGPSGTGEDGWLDIDPEDDELAAQLTNIKYRINRYGQIQVESKDEMKARHLPSPDRADALSYALCPDIPRMMPMVRDDLLINRGIMEEKW